MLIAPFPDKINFFDGMTFQPPQIALINLSVVNFPAKFSVVAIKNPVTFKQKVEMNFEPLRQFFDIII